MKKIIVLLLISFILLCLFSDFVDVCKKNYEYSIGSPVIFTRFQVKKDRIEICGIENIIGENIAMLCITDFTCDLNSGLCYEKSAIILNNGIVTITPAYNEYKIKYADNTKVLFTDNKIDGEIDLIAETITFTPTFSLDAEPRKFEIITDKNKAEELKNKVIKNYLKYNFF